MHRLQTAFGDSFRHGRLAGRAIEDAVFGARFQHVVDVALEDIVRQLVAGNGAKNFRAAQRVFVLIESFRRFDADELEDFFHQRQLVGNEAVGAGALVGDGDVQRLDFVFELLSSFLGENPCSKPA